jgi:hypothetical protein
MSFFDDYVDEMPHDEFESFVAGVRAAATRVPEPSATLAQLLTPGVSPEPKRSILMNVKAYIAGLGMAAKIMLGAGVAAAATTGAGAAGVLPDPVQRVVAATVDTVTPFNLPEPADDHGVQAAGVHADDHAGDHTTRDEHVSDTPPVTPTTVAKRDEHRGDDTPIVVIAPTTTTTTIHHEEHHDQPATTTTTVRHEEPATTSTTVLNHDGDNNNPESLSITCAAAHEPNHITCHWTASTNPDHARYALLRINNQNTERRVVWQTETGLEFTDTAVTSGWGYGYRVVSLRADGTTESHSNIFTLMCC